MNEIASDKALRKDLDDSLQELKALPATRERALAITKVQEAIMWLGMDLKRLNDGVSSYPGSYDPNDPVVHPVADNLKL